MTATRRVLNLVCEGLFNFFTASVLIRKQNRLPALETLIAGHPFTNCLPRSRCSSSHERTQQYAPTAMNNKAPSRSRRFRQRHNRKLVNVVEMHVIGPHLFRVRAKTSGASVPQLKGGGRARSSAQQQTRPSFLPSLRANTLFLFFSLLSEFNVGSQ